MMVQVRVDVVSRTPLAAGSQAVKNFPAVLQALSARPLKLTPLPESLIADLADAVPAVTAANAAEDAELLDLKVNKATRVLQIQAVHTCLELSCTQAEGVGLGFSPVCHTTGVAAGVAGGGHTAA